MVCIQRSRGLYLHHVPTNTSPLVPSWGNGVVMTEDRCGDSLASNHFCCFLGGRFLPLLNRTMHIGIFTSPSREVPCRSLSRSKFW